MKSKGLLILASAAAALSGCATVKSAREAQSRVAQNLERSDAVAVDLSGRTLSELVAYALTNRPSVASAAIAVRDARLQLREIAADAPLASATPWNAFGADASAGYSERSPAKHFDDFEFKTDKGKATAGLSVDVLLWDFGRNSARMRAQAENVVAAETALSREGFAVCDEVASAYFALLKSDALLEVAATNVWMYEEHLGRAEDRMRLGEAMQLDVLRARLDLANAKDALVSASNDVLTAGAQLMAALGVDAASGDCARVFPVRPGSLATPVRELSDTDGSSGDAYAFGCTNAPAMIIARARVKAASAQVDYALANLLPSLTASFSLNWTDPLWYWQWGVGAVQSLFTGFRKTAAVDRAVAAMESAEADLEAEGLSLSRAIELAVAERDSARESLAAAMVRVKEAKSNLDTVSGRYSVGDASRIDYTDAVSDHAAALADRIKAFYRGQAAESALLSLLGVEPEFHEEIRSF